MTDPDPPYKIDDVKAPTHRVGHAPDSRASQQQVSQRLAQQHHSDESNAEPYPPSLGSAMRQDKRTDLVRNRSKGMAGFYDRRFVRFHQNRFGIGEVVHRER